MWQDPILAETRLLREQYAGQFDHDPEAIFRDILIRQRLPGKRLVCLRPRKTLDQAPVAEADAPLEQESSQSQMMNADG